jgi:hypothetical protein
VRKYQANYYTLLKCKRRGERERIMKKIKSEQMLAKFFQIWFFKKETLYTRSSTTKFDNKRQGRGKGGREKGTT